jgi:hypothetical protein
VMPAAPRVEPVPARTENKVASTVAALEISNGHGRQGLARTLSRQIREPNLKVVRLTNEKGFAVRQTRIEYQSDFRGVAERLAEQFGTSTPVEVKVAGRANVRLVIGHDLPTLVAHRSDVTATARVAAAGAP